MVPVPPADHTTDPPVPPHRSVQPTAGQAGRAGRAPSACGLPTGNALDQAQAGFDALMAGPSPLALDGTGLGPWCPARRIDLVELRALLLEARTGLGTRDAAWARLVGHARTGGPDWVLGCVGVALPGLTAIAARATRGLPHAQADDIVSELLTAFICALGTIDLDRRAILTRLNWHARRAASRARHAASREIPCDLIRSGAPDTERPGGHVDLVLARAVAEGVLTETDVQIITDTRLQRRPCARVAAQYGLSYEALMKRRRRAETRLAAHLAARGFVWPVSRNRA